MPLLLISAWLNVGAEQDEVSRVQVCVGHSRQTKESDVIPVGTRKVRERHSQVCALQSAPVKEG